MPTRMENANVVTGHRIPNSDNVYDLGSSSYGFRSLYIDTLIYVTGTVMQGDFTPSTDNTYNLGSSTYQWKGLYLGGQAVVNGNVIVGAGASFTCDNVTARISQGITGLTVSDSPTFASATIGYIVLNRTADNPLNLSGVTINSGGADILLSNSAKIDNTTVGTLKLQTTVGGYVSVSEGQTVVKGDYLDLDLDVALRFIGSGLNVDGALIFRDNITIGRDAARVNLQVYGGTLHFRGSTAIYFDNDVNIGANNLKFTTLYLYEFDVGHLGIKRTSDNTLMSLEADTLRVTSGLWANADAFEIRGHNANDRYIVFQARDNDVGLREIARMQGAAEPWFGIGKDSDVVKATYDDKLGFFSTTPIAKPTGVAVDAAGIHAALVNLGLIAT